MENLKYNIYCCADIAQKVEHYIGSVEVTGSIPVVSSKKDIFVIENVFCLYDGHINALW